MKKSLAIMVMTVATVMLAACGSSNESATESTDASSNAAAVSADASGDSERTTFTVGFDAEFPPYGYQDEDGEYVGYDLDLAQEVCDRNGWELVKQPIDWDSKDMELSSGAIDCIWNGFTMNDREDDYTWTTPYIDNSQVFVVSASSGITSWDDLAGKAVLVQADSSALAALNDMSDLTATFGSLTEVADYNSAFLDMDAGASDAVAMDIGVAQYQISSREDGDYIILDDYISSEQYGVGFALGNEELRDQVQATLEEMWADGTFQEITKKWAEEGVVYETLCFGDYIGSESE